MFIMQTHLMMIVQAMDIIGKEKIHFKSKLIK